MSKTSKIAELIDSLVAKEQYDGILTLLSNDNYKTELKRDCSDAIHICMKYLHETNYKDNIKLYSCLENILKHIAQTADSEDVLLELLEQIETAKADYLFTTLLKALQVTLLRLNRDKVNGLEWSLNTIQRRIEEIKVPTILLTGYDEEQEKLLEENSEVIAILMNYITISLFCEPLEKNATLEKGTKVFRSTSRNMQNILACFLLQLLGKPLALLDLSKKAEDKNSHAVECAEKIINSLSNLIKNPFFLLGYIEPRLRWKRKHPDSGVYEMAPKDIFLIEEKVPITSLGIYYYLLIAENYKPSTIPKIYNPMYIFEMCLYLVEELLKCNESSLQYKGIKLGQKLIKNLNTENISYVSLDLKIHSDFCDALTKIIVYSSIGRNRTEGVQLLRNYIMQFDERGKFAIIKNLVQITSHSGLIGYCLGIYKNILAECLDSGQNTLPEHFCGTEYKNFLLKTVCRLPKNAETDLMEHSEQVLTALNIIRYLAIRDKANRTGFWDFVEEIKCTFLQPLRKGIDLSRAHYAIEEHRVKTDSEDQTDISNNLEISLNTGDKLPEITKEHKLNMLSGGLLAFDLMESLLARVNECIETHKKE